MVAFSAPQMLQVLIATEYRAKTCANMWSLSSIGCWNILRLRPRNFSLLRINSRQARWACYNRAMNQEYLRLIGFLNEAEKLKSTLRHNWTTSGRQEDSAQHAWRAAVFFIIAQGTFKLDVDPYKTLAMLVIHDLPEVEFGDIPAFVKDANPEAHSKHKAREREAARKLYAMLPRRVADQLLELQEEFDAGESKEARVAKALEKIESQLQHLEGGTQFWGEEERGEHMLHYPDAAIEKLDNEHITNIWKIIQKDIYELTYPEKELPSSAQ